MSVIWAFWASDWLMITLAHVLMTICWSDCVAECSDVLKHRTPDRICDGKADCPDFSDELNCGIFTVELLIIVAKLILVAATVCWLGFGYIPELYWFINGSFILHIRRFWASHLQTNAPEIRTCARMGLALDPRRCAMAKWTAKVVTTRLSAVGSLPFFRF